MKIKVKNVSKKFRNNFVLKDVSLEFESGKIYGLSGRNGAGKSVLLKIICGLYTPTTGEVTFNDVNYNKKDMLVPNVRALIEKPNFFPDLTGLENLQLLANIQNKITNNEIYETLKIVNLESDMNKKYSEYSLGMKQKLGIAQVLMENPEVIILDEPFNGIEEESVKQISKFLLKEKMNGKLILVSTHIKEDLEKLSDIIYYFDNGSVIQKWILKDTV